MFQKLSAFNIQAGQNMCESYNVEYNPDYDTNPDTKDIKWKPFDKWFKEDVLRMQKKSGRPSKINYPKMAVVDIETRTLVLTYSPKAYHPNDIIDAQCTYCGKTLPLREDGRINIPLVRNDPIEAGFGYDIKVCINCRQITFNLMQLWERIKLWPRWAELIPTPNYSYVQALWNIYKLHYDKPHYDKPHDKVRNIEKIMPRISSLIDNSKRSNEELDSIERLAKRHKISPVVGEPSNTQNDLDFMGHTAIGFGKFLVKNMKNVDIQCTNNYYTKEDKLAAAYKAYKESPEYDFLISDATLRGKVQMGEGQMTIYISGEENIQPHTSHGVTSTHVINIDTLNDPYAFGIFDSKEVLDFNPLNHMNGGTNHGDFIPRTLEGELNITEEFEKYDDKSFLDAMLASTDIDYTNIFRGCMDPKSKDNVSMMTWMGMSDGFPVGQVNIKTEAYILPDAVHTNQGSACNEPEYNPAKQEDIQTKQECVANAQNTEEPRGLKRPRQEDVAPANEVTNTSAESEGFNEYLNNLKNEVIQMYANYDVK